MTEELDEIPTSDDFTHCYGCGADNEHGLNLTFGLDAEAERVVASWIPPSHFAGYRRMLHGGVIASMLDEGMGWARNLNAADWACAYWESSDLGIPWLPGES